MPGCERVPDPEDSRALRLTITVEGRSVIDPAMEIVRDLQEQLTAPLGSTNSMEQRANDYLTGSRSQARPSRA